MGKRYGSSVVAFRFEYGRGTAVHLVGRFHRYDAERRDALPMRRLINNVLLERVRGRQ